MDATPGDYKPTFYYWEMLELFRKMSLIGLVSTFFPGSLLQAFMAILLCVVFLTLTAWLQPYYDSGRVSAPMAARV